MDRGLQGGALALLLLLSFFGAKSQELGKPFIRYYSPEEYNAGSYMFEAIQDSRGIIYYANSWNIRVYDGVAWSYIPIANRKEAMSFAMDSIGTVYVGGHDEVGYLAPNGKGEMEYHSLVSQFTQTPKGFGRLKQAFSTPEGIYFQGTKDILFWDGSQGMSWHFDKEIKGFFQLGRALFIQLEGGSLQLFEEGEVIELSGEDAFINNRVVGILPHPEINNPLPIIATETAGLFAFSPTQGRFIPYSSDIRSYFIENEISCVTPISGRQWAIGTNKGGLVILSPDGALVCIVDKEMGLMENQVNHIYEDKDKILWVSLNNGAAKVEISTPISSWDEKLGLVGQVNTVDRLNGRLIVGTNRGAYYLHSGAKGHSRFMGVEGLDAPVYSSINLKEEEDQQARLLLATKDGVITLEEADQERYKTREIENSPQGVFALVQSTQSQKYKYALSDDQICLLEHEPQGWVNKGPIKGIPEKYRFFIAEQDLDGDLWVVTVRNGVIRFSIDKEALEVQNLRHYTLDDGLPDYNFIGVDKIQETLVLTSEKGVYHFNEEKGKFEIAKQFGPQLADYYTGFYFFTEDPHGNLWYIAYQNGDDLWREKAWLLPDKSYKVDSTTLRRIPVMDGEREGNFIEENGIAWFGGTQGLYRYNSAADITLTQGFKAYIRDIALGEGGERIFGGTHFKQLKGKGYIAQREQHQDHEVKIPYEDNSLIFHFASNNYFDEDKNLYSYKLEGNGDDWSPWEPTTKEHIRNLREGQYTMRVRAKNIYGVISSEDSVSFAILPPWQRTIWAYIAYAVLGAFFVWLLVRLNTRRLLKQRQELELLVKERTADIEKQKEEIESQASYLKQANEEITSKNDVLAQQQEELVTSSEEISRKNEMLNTTNKQMRDSINYAGRIQKALLGGEREIVSHFDDAFVMLRPKDIVSGDFYWFTETYKDGKPGDVLLIAADCTGHGVPGAFMTVMGNALLNEIVNERGIIEPDEVLTRLDKRVVSATSRQSTGGHINDGMDMSVVKLSPCQKYVRYAGAKNPLYRVRDGEIEVFKGSKFPIGSSQFKKKKVFDRVDVDARPGDKFYIASDGYQDQFGGPNGKKYLRKRFRELLLQISDLPMKQQKASLIEELENWQGRTQQTDDILVIGFAIDKEVR